VSTDDLRHLAERLQAICLEQELTVATAESCTGGLVADTLTDVPGSSGYLLGGIIAYADRIKERQLGVAPELLATHGAVSAQVARAMAVGVRERFEADLGAAVTGIAGPGGGTTAKPVGSTYVAVAGPAGVEVRRFAWTGDRGSNKRSSVVAVLELLAAVAEASRAPAPAPASPGAR
jgi:PncC family amidohydrolase